MNHFLQLIAIVSLQYGPIVVQNEQSYVLTSSCGGVVTEGSSCVLTCETSAVTETPIVWTRGTNPPYGVKRTTCTTSDPAVPSDYVLACPGTSFTLTITNASVIRDKTTWKCGGSLGGKESDAINLDVKVQNEQSYVLTSSCGGVVTEGSSCVLTCETSAVTETPIVWTRGTNPPYGVKRTTCTTSDPSVPSDYVLACPGTSFTLNITAASVTRDKTTWKCGGSLGGKKSDAINLDVKVQNEQSYVLTSSCGGVVTEGSSCVLTCETSAVTETPIVWTRGTNPPYGVKRTTCTTSDPSVPSDYVLACPGTSFTLNITAASVTRDKTTWKCGGSLGGKKSDAINLDVKGSPSTATAQPPKLLYLLFLIPVIIIGISIGIGISVFVLKVRRRIREQV
ncbi:uncharacterized protein [Haliotis cracherodii]|uniref:uncharacterized protein n=1 Tax=Haliotis cracherodii TaxID=6455 RepID=UPI0039E9A1AF